MADARRFADLRQGHAGRLAYVPSKVQDECGTLHTTRATTHFPHLRQLGSMKEIYPASRYKAPEPTFTKLHTERNLQRRWLLQSHPEAFAANQPLSEQLTHDIKKFQRGNETVNNQPLMAIGDITNAYDPSRIVGLPALAAATGESGEILRITRLHNAKWTWNDDADRLLHIPTVESDVEDEACWTSDGLPITQIKFVSYKTRYETIRWIIAQKQTSTTLLQPIYRRIARPEAETITPFSQTVSRIDPNPICSLSHGQTGGNAHSDAAIIAGGTGEALRLCVMDECGYWTIWAVGGEVQAGRNSTRLSLYRMGHIYEGWLDEIPSISPYPAQPHGLVAFSQKETKESWTTISYQDTKQGLMQDQRLVSWKSDRWVLVDMSTGSIIPPPADFSVAANQYGNIIDVQSSPVNSNHIFVLTLRFLVLVDTFATDEESEEPRQKIILSCSHNTDPHANIKLDLCDTSADDGVETMAFLYSTDSRQITMFWFSHAPKQDLIRWHSHTTSLQLGGEDAPEIAPNQSITFRLCKQKFRSAADDLNSSSDANSVQFLQVTVLSNDFSVCQAMWFTALDPTVQVELPSIRTAWSKDHEARLWKKKRRQVVVAFGEVFAVPDKMTKISMEDVGQRQKALGNQPREAPEDTKARLFDFRVIASTLREALETKPKDIGLPMALSDTLQRAVDNGQREGRLSLITWQEAQDELAPDMGTSTRTDFDTEDELRELMDRIDESSVITHLGRRSNGKHDPLVGFSQLKQEFSALWLEPLRKVLSTEDLRHREAWVAVLARDIFMRSHGVIVQDIPLFGTAGHDSLGASRQQLPSSQHFPASSQIPASSQQWGSNIPSSPPATPSAAIDGAIQRLQLLAPSLQPGTLSASKPAAVLSHWPTERGVSTDSYLSSVAIAHDQKFDGARDRQKRIEKKRRTMAEKYKRPPGFSSQRAETQQTESFVPRGPTIMSSQVPVPESSQSQGFAMSQPVPGIFGDRKKVKAKKKKSGFR